MAGPRLQGYFPNRTKTENAREGFVSALDVYQFSEAYSFVYGTLEDKSAAREMLEHISFATYDSDGEGLVEKEQVLDLIDALKRDPKTNPDFKPDTLRFAMSSSLKLMNDAQKAKLKASVQ